MGEPRKAGRHWFGLFLAAGGGFVLYVLLTQIEIPRVAMVLGVNVQRWFLAGVALQTMKWLLVIGSALAVAVGFLMLFVPRLLEAFEARMNRWYSTSQLLPSGGESMKFPLDLLVEAYPRAAGWIIAAGSLVVAVAMGILLVARLAG